MLFGIRVGSAPSHPECMGGNGPLSVRNISLSDPLPRSKMACLSVPGHQSQSIKPNVVDNAAVINIDD